MLQSTLLNTLHAWIVPVVFLFLLVQDCVAQTDVDSADIGDATVIAFVNVAVVTMQDEMVLQEQTVVIVGDRIVSIGSFDTISVPQDAMVIDGSGRYLIPGLADMHVHVRVPFDDGPLYLNAGITTVLSMGTRADSWNGERISEREHSRTPAFIGPTLYTVGPQIRGGETTDEVEQIVRFSAERGFDFVKVHGNVSAEAFNRLQETAEQVGIRVTGHGQRHRGMEPVYNYKQDLAHVEEYLYASFNPITPGFIRATQGSLLVLSLLLLTIICWGLGALWRRVRRRDNSGQFQSVRRWVGLFTAVGWLFFIGICVSVTEPFPGFFAGKTLAIVLVVVLMLLVICTAWVLSMNVRYAWRKKADTIWKRAGLVFVVVLAWTFVICSGFLIPRTWRATQSAMEHIAEKSASAGIWVTPTLVVYDYNRRQNTDEFFELIKRPGMQYLRPAVRDEWINRNWYRRPAPFTGMQFAIWQSWTELMSRLTMELHAAGVPLLAGSDAVGPPGPLPGSSLHEELSLLVQAGLTPYEALRTATVNPAIYLNSETEFGTIAEGLRADLVLLAANPLDDIDNVRTRVGVMKRGRWFSASEMVTALAQLAEDRK